MAQPPQRTACTTSASQPTQRSRRSFLDPLLQRPKPMSKYSSPQVPDSGWTGENFLLGAGMVVFQPETLQVVILYESKKKYWFLPKGRKDVGESLEQAALREAHEESGYRVEFLPLYNETRAPGPPDDRHAPYRLNCEPVYIGTAAYPARVRGNRIAPAGEYLTFWYIGQIPEDAVHEEGTGMPDEVNYEAHLMDVKQAVNLLYHDEAVVVQYAWELFCWTHSRLEKERNQPLPDKERVNQPPPDAERVAQPSPPPASASESESSSSSAPASSA